MIIKSFKTSAVSLKKQRLTVAIGGGQSVFIVLLRAVIHQGGSSLGPDSHSFSSDPVSAKQTNVTNKTQESVCELYSTSRYFDEKHYDLRGESQFMFREAVLGVPQLAWINSKEVTMNVLDMFWSDGT